MSMVLFAIIGASIDAGTAYWFCFAFYCTIHLLNVICNVVKEM